MRRSLVAIVAVSFACGCHTDVYHDSILVLEYDDFGPQAVAHELLGSRVYQWHDQCCADMDEQGDIGVVVYEGVPKLEVMKRYPVIAGKEDYRYVRADATERFLALEIAECREGMLEVTEEGVDAKEGSYEVYESLTARLSITLDRIRKQFERD